MNVKHTQKEMLEKLQIEKLNDMQQEMQDSWATEENILLISPTGSGKTLGFLLPLVSTIDVASNNTQAMIIAPARELAIQIGQVLRSLGTGIRVALCYGGNSFTSEKQDLQNKPHVVIGTPGRIVSHIEKDSFEAGNIHTFIVDEFDKTVKMGFHRELRKITDELFNLKKQVLTSATKSVDIPGFLKFTDPKCIDYSQELQVKTLSIKAVESKQKDKLPILLTLIRSLDSEPKIIFCGFKDAAERVSGYLYRKGFKNGIFHGEVDQKKRELSLLKLRNGSQTILVTTDLAARGLDIPEIKHIIHYHIPTDEKTFTHRNGRTARMNAKGSAYLIYAENQRPPDYLTEEPEIVSLTQSSINPPEPKYETLYVSAGRKDKINKVDLVGFFYKQAALEKDELGKIEVYDYVSYIAVARDKVEMVVKKLYGNKVKGKKVLVGVAK